MSLDGFHFALSKDDVVALRGIDLESPRLSFFKEKIEQRYLKTQPTYVARSAKSWDAIHRALADGLLNWTGGLYPLNHTILAGELLYTGNNYIMSLKSPEAVADISASLAEVDRQVFRGRYNLIIAEDYGSTLGNDDFEATWVGFQNVRSLYAKAASVKRYVLFTADQQPHYSQLGDIAH